jgi:hypothetical protein
MIKLKHLIYVKEIKLSRKNFPWTFYGLIGLNLSVIVTSIVVGLEKKKELFEIISAMPYGFLIVTCVSLAIFPFVDIWENIADRVMCLNLDLDYQTEFLDRYDINTQEKIRDAYIKGQKDKISDTKIKEIINQINLVYDSKE